MTHGEVIYLGLVIAAMVIFGVTLAGVSQWTRGGRR